MKSRSGFTIVEVVIVITVIAILASIISMTFGKAQMNARDAARSSSATIISESLERYYEKNGEYPSVASLTNENPSNTGAAIAAKLSIPPTVLMTPNMPTTVTNAITSNPDSPEDYIAYLGQSQDPDEDVQCKNNATSGCDQYTLQYAVELSDGEKVIESRHRSRTTELKPDLELDVTSMSSISATWSTIPDATSYELQRSLTSDFSSPVTTTHASTSAAASSLAPDTEYYFRVRALLPGALGNWSDTQSAITSNLAAPTGTLTISAAMSGANALGTAGGGTCPAGATIERQIRYQVNTGTWSSYITGATRDVPATAGYKYTFQQQARCKIGATSGPWGHSTTASVINPVTAPSGLTITATMSGTNARGTAGGGTCPAGTTIERQIRHQVNTGAWTAYTAGTPRDVPANQGYRYTFQQQARCNGTSASSGWAASSTANVTRAVAVPSGTLTMAAGMSGTNARGTAGGGACPAGTTIERQIRYNGTNSNTAGAWSSYTTGTPRDAPASQGYRYTFQQQARCVGAYASSGYITSNPAGVVRPITSMPTGGSASASTSGASTTFSYNGVSGCPAGTTVVYTYRYMTAPGNTYPLSWTIGHPSYNNPIHNWDKQLPATAAYRTFVWNTSATNTKYHVHFAAMCSTVHHTGPWPDSVLADAASYFRP